jgi:alkanesulfonate monooxygenase SsuD/methylene tetrahydromethanopterin reductase-like flavin-dependent oxidoreductase (luciferase family)
MVAISYGTYPAQGITAGGELQEEIGLAEEAGFSAIYFSEHHGVRGYPPSPLALTHFALGGTRTLRAGPMPLLLPLHDPVRIAEETALIDHLSGGRLVLGVAPGFLAADFNQEGIPSAERGKRLDEGLEIIRRLWAGDSQEFHGDFYRAYGKETLTFLPWGGRRPDLWMCSGTKTGMRRALRIGAGLVIDSVQSFAAAEAAIRQYRELAGGDERHQPRVAVMRRAWLGDSEEVHQFAQGYSNELQRYVNLVGESPAPWTDALRDTPADGATAASRAFVGTPDQVSERIVKWAGSNGITEIILKFQWGERDFTKIRNQMARSSEVIRNVATMQAAE